MNSPPGGKGWPLLGIGTARKRRILTDWGRAYTLGLLEGPELVLRPRGRGYHHITPANMAVVVALIRLVTLSL